MDSSVHKSTFNFDLFFTTVNSYYRTAAVKAAIEVGLFEAVGQKGQSIEAIAKTCQASVRGIRILCYYLVSIGFLCSEGDVFFMNRDMAIYLDQHSPGYLGDSIKFLLSPYIMNAFSDLTNVIKTGQISLAEKGVIAPDHPQWIEFAKAMAPMMALPSSLIANMVSIPVDSPIRVLDIAAGHGLFGIAFAQRFRKAEISFLDWDNVLDVARENAQMANVTNRMHFLAGSAFEVNYGQGYDVILLANFLHHFGQKDCEKSLTKVLNALSEDGVAITFEFIANEDRTSPPLSTTFSMMMLCTTPAGESYTYSDLKKMFRNVGFGHIELKTIPPALLKVVLSYKREL